jgi:lactate dehydrogenase-like 2-hydroxyacid dehydrogenase
MNDRERLKVLLDTLQSLDGLDEERFQRLTAELQRHRIRDGYFVLDDLTGFDMRGKQAGVIGTGKIGQCTIDILLGFGCRILAFKFPNAARAE